MQELLWQVMNQGDDEKSKKVDLNNRVPFIEVDSEQYNIYSFDIIEKMPPPRLMKTHVPKYFFDKLAMMSYVTLLDDKQHPRLSLTNLYLNNQHA